MKLLNEIIDDNQGIPIEGFSNLFPLDYVFPFKTGDSVFVNDLEVSKFRFILDVDYFLSGEKKLVKLLSNANRIGTVKSIKKNKHARGSGKIKLFSFSINVTFQDHSDNEVDFLITNNPRFISKIGQ